MISSEVQVDICINQQSIWQFVLFKFVLKPCQASVKKFLILIIESPHLAAVSISSCCLTFKVFFFHLIKCQY